MATFPPISTSSCLCSPLSLARRGLEPPVPCKVTMSVRQSLCLCHVVSNYAAFRDTWKDNKVLCLHLPVWRSPILSQGLLLSAVVWGMESFLPISTVSSSHPPSQFCPCWNRLSFSLSKSKFVSCSLFISGLGLNALCEVVVFAPSFYSDNGFPKKCERLSHKAPFRYYTHFVVTIQ